MATVRIEESLDIPAIDRVVRDAFTEGDETPLELGLVRDLRAAEAWIPNLALVALEEIEIVGFCATTRGWVADRPVLALGPIGVMRDHQRLGIGSTLVNKTIEKAAAAGESLIGLLGDPGYYSRFGFVAAAEAKVIPPVTDWGSAFQVLVLDEDRAPTGVFAYPDAFGV